MIRGPVALRIVGEGQSLLNTPLFPQYGKTIGFHLMRGSSPRLFAGKGFAYRNEAINATSLTTLRSTAATRVFRHVDRDTQTGLLMVYGTSDILAGDDGSTLYNEAVEYATAAKTAGFDWVVATTITGYGGFTEPQEDARQDHNELLIANGSGIFDRVINLEVPPLTDVLNSYYYYDQLHGTGEWCKIVAKRCHDGISTIPSVAALL